MNGNRYIPALGMQETTGTEYPKLSILAAMALSYLAPFVSSFFAYIAFVICLYRVIRYDARVFAADYCLLMPIARLFSTSGGFTLLVWLCLFAAVWYTILRGIRADSSYVILIVLLNYLILRMQMEVGSFVLCFGHLFVLCVLLPQQDEESAERAAKLFCIGLIVSSVYALVLRDTWQIQAVRGEESEAIWGTGIMRFMGLMGDPNYYMTTVIVSLALLIKLKDCNRLPPVQFWVMGIILTFFGVLTYSKTFLLVFVMLGGIYIIWQFWNRKVFSGMFLSIAAVTAASILLFSEESPLSVIMDRFLRADNLSDLTTGRSDIYVAYWDAVTKDAATFFLGKGIAAEGLYRDPHNVYLEIMYHIGVIGLLLFVGFYFSIVHVMKMHTVCVSKQHFIAKYVVLLMTLVLFMTLNGMFQTVIYGNFFLAFLSIMITKKQPDPNSLKERGKHV